MIKFKCGNFSQLNLCAASDVICSISNGNTYINAGTYVIGVDANGVIPFPTIPSLFAVSSLFVG
jgi:hypothetical protein